MRRTAFLFVLIVSVSCSSKESDAPSEAANWCASYLPGEALSYESYERKWEAMGGFNVYSAITSYGAYTDYLSSVERESTGALYRVFSDFYNGTAQVWYGSYNSPDTYGDDSGRGFRVVGKTTLRDGSGKRFLVTAISFWGMRNGRLQLLGGPDTMRVRLQLEADSAAYSTGRFVSVGYQAELSDSGEIKSLKPTELFGTDLKKRPDVPSALVPTGGNHGCFFCHSSTTQFRSSGFERAGLGYDFDLRDAVVDETRVTPDLRPSLQQFVDSMSASERTPELLDSFKTPKKTFLPAGLFSVLNARCKSPR